MKTTWQESLRRSMARSEAGFTLIEALVAMVIFGVMMSVMTSVIVAMTDNMRQTEGVSLATDQNRLAFQRLDKLVRYALAIGEPAEVGGALYVEMFLEHPKDTGQSGADIKKWSLCEQWKYVQGDGTLQKRSWTVRWHPVTGAPNGVQDVSDWTTVATGLTNTPAQPVFKYEAPSLSVPPSDTDQIHQGLTVDLRAKRSKKPVGQAQLRATFFARNTDTLTDPSGVCTGAPHPVRD